MRWSNQIHRDDCLQNWGQIYDPERCRDCISWDGPGVGVDHAHCKQSRSPHKTTSKHGDRKYDTCLYFKTRQPVNPVDGDK